MPIVADRSQYSAERMCLAVLGGESLDTLESWVRDMFQVVRSGLGPRRDFSSAGFPFAVRSMVSAALVLVSCCLDMWLLGN